MQDKRIVYSWSTHRRFNAYSDYMKNKYGTRVQKLSIDAGFSCPNRDGTKGTGGCTFCLNDAFNPSYCNPLKSVTQQIKEGIDFHERRYRRASKYIAYFQAFSNTHGSLSKLSGLYEEALNVDGVIGIAVGTRPDCIDRNKLLYLKKLSEKFHVIVEYGIESVYDKTLKRINRGHTFQEAVDAINATAEMGINVGAHFILGLPGENLTEMLDSARIISKLPLNTLKIHQLQLFKGTVMEKEFYDKPDDFHFFTMDEYLEFMTQFISLINPRFVIERIAGETPPRYTVINPWGPRYDKILVSFEKLLEKKNIWQGMNAGNLKEMIIV